MNNKNLIEKVGDKFKANNCRLFDTLQEAEDYIALTLANKKAFDKANPHNYSRSFFEFGEIKKEHENYKQLNP